MCCSRAESVCNRSLEQIGEGMEQGGKAGMSEDKEGSASVKGWPQVTGSGCKGK